MLNFISWEKSVTRKIGRLYNSITIFFYMESSNRYEINPLQFLN